MLTKLIAVAAAQQDNRSSNVHLCLERCHSTNRRQQATLQVIDDKMDNGQKRQFALELIETIYMVNQNDNAEKRAAAEKELAALFGRDFLKDPSALQPKDKLFYSLTGDGRQFRVWYSPFGQVKHTHFDSRGSGCLLTADSVSEETLMEWITPLVKGMVQWNCNRSSIWIGHHPVSWY